MKCFNFLCRQFCVGRFRETSRRRHQQPVQELARAADRRPQLHSGSGQRNHDEALPSGRAEKQELVKIFRYSRHKDKTPAMVHETNVIFPKLILSVY
jgi:hypothetical protein